MTAFTYVVTEGVHDVAFIGRLLAVTHEAKRIRTLEELDADLGTWLAGFKWPNLNGANHDIARLAVPAPVFYRLPEGKVLVLRNAQGLTKIGPTLEVDLESFSRANNLPEAIGIILDSDDEFVEQRFAKLKTVLDDVKLAVPHSLGEVNTGNPRVGIFAFPQPGVAGTLEDLLLELGSAAYPKLASAARTYVDACNVIATADQTTTDWKELRKPAGTKKATIGAIAAILKPGKSLQVSLEDNRWLSEATKTHACLQPILTFVNALLSTPSRADNETGVTPPPTAK